MVIENYHHYSYLWQGVFINVLSSLEDPPPKPTASGNGKEYFP